jgi:hypothetical protein
MFESTLDKILFILFLPLLIPALILMYVLIQLDIINTED